MVKISPFKALRYPVKSGKNDISSYICPPYDVISPKEREQLVKKSPRNVVQLELPRGEGVEKYTNAASLLRIWLNKGDLKADRKAAFYLLETTYKIKDPFAPTTKLKRYGVLTGLRLETPGKGSIRPHEKTLPKAKEDRLNLLKAVQTNISPIFGLFFDTKDEWNKWIRAAVKKKPIAVGHEEKELDHRLWVIEDPQLIVVLKKILETKELYIADGHHRYEVAWAYKDARLKGHPSAPINSGWNSIMAYVCPIEEKGLLMLPTHRLVRSAHTVQDWKHHLNSLFTIEEVRSSDEIIKTLAKKNRRNRSMGWINNSGAYLLTLKKEISIERCLSHRPQTLQELDVILLHDMAMGEAPGVNFLGEHSISYTRDIKLMEEQIKADPHYVAFILGPLRVSALAKVAKAGEVMPPKTTYFYPKVPTGFTMMPLDQSIS